MAKPPHIRRLLAHSLAAQANAVAQALAHAQTLQHEVDQSAGQIPRRLLARLKPVVDALPGRITCNPAPPPGPEPKPKPKHEKPPKHDHGHGHGNGNGNDDH